MDLRNTKSYENLENALANEAKAIVRYYIYAQKARREGYIEASELFEKMAKNELEHAKVWHKMLHPEEITVEECIKEVANIENYEWKEVYPAYADIAEEEGLKEVADMLTRISAIECEHERRFVEFHLKFSEKIAKKDDIKEVPNVDTVVDAVKKIDVLTYCLFCGFPSEKELEICPVCGAKDSFKA